MMKSNEEPIMELDLTIPRDVELSHEGRWIAWDAEQRAVLADGDSMDEVLDATDDAREAGKLIWYHHILPRDELIVGGL